MAGKNVPVSPLAPKRLPKPAAIEGVTFATAEAGIRYKGRTDVLLAVLAEGTRMAGVFTRSKCPSAAVDWCRAILPGGRARGLVVNSGNANAFTGMKGRESVRLTAEIAAKALGCRPEEVALASTGVIGEPLDATKFNGVLGDCAARATGDAWQDAARAIMTTDTFPKIATKSVKIDGVSVTISGIAKGAGMIAPDMATMLAFVFTDAAIGESALQAMLAAGVKDSFNAITVDSDTSTSDTLMLFATGAAARRGQGLIDDPRDPRLSAFRAALKRVLKELAILVVKDGEGARKFVTVTVEGARGQRSAKRVALAIANSPLVKTAIAGEDANWGRIVMAVGKAGEPAERDRLAIHFGPHRLAVEGARDPAYDEVRVSEYMRGERIDIRVELGLGRGRATVYTCDLTKAYVEINGDYRS
ncbi:MAG: bifunctional glutamate N-acetyltransferase/amino-acid acetyltransferase ArgJ [Hyphomicrobiales bacterium]|uniref:bifunctional glutamate N-acetyltransferase/amino-acid acetyltransferase ArgJ n=1 Tax=Rhabdaerophilum calidifontis TaxID=2604328 RepID=UPI001238EA34|nr:bifunctional glutamate N-acetyltransferase/amino-acid acetyltransferase ArgJ [Rhabdaerophilum calidifontis]MCA1951989.1 bifunctional glutamate N-acetyltransferase/amino-acid acetyltransferase ArgJ [Hyphomicrobiales bacterium]MCA1998798.1 bifunctional glutamate N-acetyltransferase/amino-acid acetyltransferase ArgJ [Hyphomicrobiales bacterium]